MLVNSNKKNCDIENNTNNELTNIETGKILEFPTPPEGILSFKESKVIIKRNNDLISNITNTNSNNILNKLNTKDKKSNIIKFKNPNKKGNGFLPPKNGLFIALGATVLASSIWFLTNKNGIEVFVDDKSIGIIPNEDITVEELTNTSLAKLKEQLGTDIKVNEKISIKPVHASKKEIVSTESVLSEITNSYTFEVEASSIIVDGKEIAIVKNEEEAKKVLDAIKSKYIPKDTPLASEPTFVEKVEVKNKFIPEEDITTNETAISLLNVNSEQGKKYTIQAGDTLSKIASDADMTIAELLKINPGLTEDTMLKIGQELNLVVAIPLLSVIVEEQVVYTEPIKKPIETINNDKEYKTYKKVISAGKDGSKEVTAKVKKVNGVEESKEIISEKVLVEAIPEKVEVGTLNTPPKKAIGNFIYPVSGARLTSEYGARWGTTHKGIDLACPAGTPIKASDGGTVVFSGWGNGYGNMIKIDHGNGFSTIYGHNSKNAVSVGQKVAQGEVIGYVGSTGNSTGNHVHFEVLKNGISGNPLNYLK